MEDNSNTTNDDSSAGTGEKNSNLAITIVIVAGILLGAILLFRSPSEDMVSPTPGPGTPQIIQPMATPPTSTATQPVRPTPVQPTAVFPTAVQPTAIHPTLPPVQPNPIQEVNWQWVNVTDSSTGQATTVPTPAQYTITFNMDGTVNGLADCNSFSGTYSQVSGLSIKITTMTRAACPDGSLDQQYLQLLNNVAAGGPDGAGNLALETAGGAQRMLFQNGGPGQ
jgi:heat shock protein HslJ